MVINRTVLGEVLSMKDRQKQFQMLLYILIGMLVAITAVTYLYDFTFFVISCLITILGITAVLIRLAMIRREITSFVEHLGVALSQSQRESMETFPIALIVTKNDGEIVWYNKRCKELMLPQGEELFEINLSELSGDIKLGEACPPSGYDVEYNGRQYTAFTSSAGEEGEGLNLVYFVDDNDLKWYHSEYFQTRPCVIILQIDNYDEMLQIAKDNDHPQIMTEVEILIENSMKQSHALLRSYFC